MVIIYINFVEVESLMLHGEFQDPLTSGSGGEDFKGITICRRACDLKHLYKLSFLFPMDALYKVWF